MKLKELLAIVGNETKIRVVEHIGGNEVDVDEDVEQRTVLWMNGTNDKVFGKIPVIEVVIF